MSGSKPDEDIRRPMQWSGERNAGFSSGSPWRDPYKDYTTVNVIAQDPDTNSLLNHYRELIHLRMDNQALLNGELLAVDADNSRVIAFIRENAEHTFLIVANPSNQAVVNVGLTLEKSQMVGTLTPQVVFGQGSPASLTVGNNGEFSGYIPVPELAAKSAVILQLR